MQLLQNIDLQLNFILKYFKKNFFVNFNLDKNISDFSTFKLSYILNINLDFHNIININYLMHYGENMAKRKETFFERLAKKNAQHETKNSKIQVKKRKGRSIFILGSVLTAAIVIGITIPLAVTGTRNEYIDPISRQQNLYTFNANGKKINFNVGYVEDVNKEQTENNYQAQLKEINKLAIYYLYDQEQKASVEYQKLWNASLKNGETRNTNIQLKTIDELKNQYSNELKDIKNDTIKKYGYDNWQTQFNQLLIDKYNGATNEEEAINNSVFEHIKLDALRRFKLSTNSIDDIVDRVANSDIQNTSDNTVIKKGEKVFSWLKEITNNNLDGNYFKINNKYISFMTESFLPSQKSAKPFIEHYLKNDNPYVISQFTLPGIAKVKNSDNWNVDKELFKRLMFAWPISSNEEKNIVYSYDKIKDNFKPFSEYANLLNSENNTDLPANAKLYNDILQKLSNDDDAIKNNFGTQGLISLSSLFTNDDNALKAFVAIKEILLNNKEQIKEIDLFGMLKNIQNNINSYLKITAPTFESSDTFDKKKEKITKYNEEIQKAFDNADNAKKTGLYDDKFKELITDEFEKTFDIGPNKNENKQLYTFYKLKDSSDTYIVLTKKGVSLINMQDIVKNNTNDNINTIIKMIQNDYVLKNKYSQLSGVNYNAINVINSTLTNDNYINDVMLNSPDFKEYLKKQTNIFNPKYNVANKENPSYTEEEINNLISLNKNAINAVNAEKALNITENISKWMEERAKNEADAYFESKDNQTYFVNNNDNYQKTADYLLNEKLISLLNLFKNR
ncbi:hypothetical protein ASB56_00435 [Mycoplasmopsis meleagridis]|nr:hypothetical protein ASB56_00435 [Mycoplasmopsis meleagridis]